MPLHVSRDLDFAHSRVTMLRGSFFGTGRVACAEELDFLAALCVKHDAIAISDEVYEGCVFAGSGAAHLRPVQTKRTLISGYDAKACDRMHYIATDAAQGCSLMVASCRAIFFVCL